VPGRHLAALVVGAVGSTAFAAVVLGVAPLLGVDEPRRLIDRVLRRSRVR
jgi:hypothetical protein